MDEPPLRPLIFVGAAEKEYRRFPQAVMAEMGYRLLRVQAGVSAAGEKALVGGALKGLGIREIRDDFDRDTYRVVYTVKLAHAIYVLHAFKKKSTFAIETPKHDVDLIRRRYQQAVQFDAARQTPPEQGRVR